MTAPAMKTLRVSLVDLEITPAGPGGTVTGEVWAELSQQVRTTDGQVVVLAAPRRVVDSTGICDFQVPCNDDAGIMLADRGFGVVVGWDLTSRGARGSVVTDCNVGTGILVTSADPSVTMFAAKAPASPTGVQTVYSTTGPTGLTGPTGPAGSVYPFTWAPGTAYTLNQQIVSPNNDVGTCNVAHTSASAYTITEAANWSVSSTYVKITDPGAVISAPSAASDPTYAYTWLAKSKQILAGWLKNGDLKLLRGLVLDGGSRFTAKPAAAYSKVSLDRNGRIGEDALLADGTAPQWLLNRWASRMSLPPAVVQTVTLWARPTPGTGEFASPKLANDSIHDATPLKQYIINFAPGRYTETNWIVKDYVTVRGTLRDACILEGALPDNSTTAAITSTSTLWLYGTARLENLTVTARNMRYAVHSETSGASTDYLHEAVNCRFEHYGNDGARTWRTANPGAGMAAGDVWLYEAPWGYGASSGGVEHYENCTFIDGPISANVWGVHDNNDFAAPARHELTNCRLVSPVEDDTYLAVSAMGSGVSSTVNVNNCETSFLYVRETDSPWISVLPANLVANHSQITVSVSGSGPIGFLTLARGTALKIQSASVATVSTVTTSGTAATVLMGQAVVRPGGGGLKGYTFGQWDVSGILCGLNSDQVVANTMGRRLGNCSTVNKTLTIAVDGGTPVNVVFTADHTASTNAAILALINTALGSTAVASEYLVCQGETYPDFPDRTRTLVNAGTTGIPRFAGVKFSGSRRRIALMGTADPIGSFAGVALEPIPPGALGRILRTGLLDTTAQLSGLSTTIAFDAPIYLSDTIPGAFSLTGTRPVLTGEITGWARF